MKTIKGTAVVRAHRVAIISHDCDGYLAPPARTQHLSVLDNNPGVVVRELMLRIPSRLIDLHDVRTRGLPRSPSNAIRESLAILLMTANQLEDLKSSSLVIQLWI